MGSGVWERGHHDEPAHKSKGLRLCRLVRDIDGFLTDLRLRELTGVGR